MATKIQEAINKAKPHFLKYKKYIKENDWTTLKAIYNEENKGKQKSTVDLRKEEFLVQQNLVKAILDRLKVFVTRNEGDKHLKAYKDFVTDTLNIVEIHTERADNYITFSDLEKIKDTDLRASEIAFHNEIYTKVSSIEDEITKLAIKEEQQGDGITFLKDHYATIPMHNILVRKYPEIQNKLDSMGIDFESEPPKTIHILNENPPKWNREKNYWEQEPETLQYYVDEYKKIEKGIEIDGYYIDGWLYWHFNFFVTDIPTTRIINGIKENKDVIKVPELRDNEIIITEYFNKSRKEGLYSLIAATRRAAKTTMNASRIGRARVLGKKSILCAGGSSEDLAHIHKNLDTLDNNIDTAFKVMYLSPTEDKRGKSYGIKDSANKSIIVSNVYILNLEGGTKTQKGESLAGFTPDEFILDEAMKFPFKHQLEALEPALWGNGVLRCSAILTGTGGDSSLAVDAIKMLNRPKENRVCLMDWEWLNSKCPEQYRTWNEKEFGLFLPTQMCVIHPKIQSNLANYLGIESETLSKIPVWITDWENAKEFEDKVRLEKAVDKKAYVRQLAYHPFTPEEIFLSGKVSPFPVKEAKEHKEYILQKGLWDRRRDIYRNSEGKVQFALSKKELAPFPHKGGFVDAPALIFQEPEENIRYGMYSAGFDDYATEDSESDSVSTFYIMKNKILGDPFSEKIVASLSFRPEKHQEVWEQWLMLMEAYKLNQTCFGENFNYEIKSYLDRRHLADVYLAPGLDFSQSFNIPNNGRRKTGWNPTTTKRYLFDLFVEYCKEEFEIELETGEIVVVKGVQRIDDIGLLDEIINWSENSNVDRITAVMGAYGYMHYLQSSNRWRVKEYISNEERERIEMERKKNNTKPKKSFYSTRNRSFNVYKNR